MVVGGWSSGQVHRLAVMLLLGGLLIECSIGLIIFNKYLMNQSRFPFAVPLVMMQVIVSFGFSCLLLVISPSLFPSLTDPMNVLRFDRNLFTRGLMPIAAFFVGHVVLSNTAYLHSSVAFLQMMKESNLVLVYTFSLVVGLEYFRFRNVAVVVCIIVGTTMTINGEMHFSKTGFVLQSTSQLFESLKVVLQGLLLSRAGMKLDALSYVLLMTPGCLVLLSVVLGVLYAHPSDMMRVPMWSDFAGWWPMLFANACIAFALNVVAAVFLKHSSPMGYILVGILKDALVVLAGTYYLGDAITHQQMVGFLLQLSSIMIWMLMKSFPDKFEGGLMTGISGTLGAIMSRDDAPKLHKQGSAASNINNGMSPKYGAHAESPAAISES